MGFRCRAALAGVVLVLCGCVASAAWQHGLWGTLSGTLLVAAWTGAVLSRTLDRAGTDMQLAAAADTGEVPIHRFLLDAVPTPMLTIEQECVRAINRAARHLFATDDRVLPLPVALTDAGTGYLRHEGRSWRINRVLLDGDTTRMVVALIDVEREERTAEARAAAQLIQVLGHELMNGLAPVSSLAESGLQAVTADPPDTALLRDILGTLVRHSEGLQRFAEAYRALARLPEPRLCPVPVAELMQDLGRLFAGRWPQVRLEIDAATDVTCLMDRDQISQALWAVLQNAAEAASSSPAPQPTVSMRTGRNATWLVIEIVDNGQGIDADRREQIFRPFYTTKPDGTGIGLSLARQIAHGHGGSLSVKNFRPTTFSLCLPRA